MEARLSDPVRSVPGVTADRPVAAPPLAAPILVTGGTRTLGRLVVARLRASGCAVRVLSRRRHAGGAGTAGNQAERGEVAVVAGDLSTGDGIDAAVEGAEVVVHCSPYRWRPHRACRSCPGRSVPA
jgi:uncharacterized protein YbjT (DUF2867 family)